MLEKYISSLLVPYFSEYVENIDAKQLNIDIWNGRATLHDLVLKPTVLDILLSSFSQGGEGPRSQLPVQLFRGVCKNVRLVIPIQRLRSKPVVVEIGELFITLEAECGKEDVAGGDLVDSYGISKGVRWDRVAAQKDRELDDFETERRQQQKKAATDFESPSEAPMSEREGQKGRAKSSGGFFSQLAELVVNNIIVKVHTVHVRYEDPHNSVVMGVILGGVQFLTVDEVTGQATFVDPSGLQRASKRLVFDDVQMYCEDLSHHLFSSVEHSGGSRWHSKLHGWDLWYQAMRQRVQEGNVPFSTVFGPVSGSVELRLVFRRFARELLDTPYVSVKSKLQKVMARLTRAQYTTIINTFLQFMNWNGALEVALRRPKVPVFEHARIWWRYAIQSVLRVLTEPRRERLLQRISQICLLDYQVLYREVMRKAELPAERKRIYRFITRFMTVQDMISGRKAVYAQLANEIQLRRKETEHKNVEALTVQQQAQSGQRSKGYGILGWLRRIPIAPTAAKFDDEEEILQNLAKDYDIDLSLDSIEAESGDMVKDGGGIASKLPPSYAWLEIGFDIPFASYQIDFDGSDAVGMSADAIESASLCFYHLHGGVRVLNANKSFAFHFAIQNISLSNPAVAFAPGRMLPILVEGLTTKSPDVSTQSLPISQRVFTEPIRSSSSSELEDGETRLPEFPTLQQLLQLSSGEAKGDSSMRHSTSGRCVSVPPSFTPFLRIGGALNPVEQPLEDTRLDVAVSMRMQPLRIVADPTTVKQLIHFFDVPSGADLSRLVASTRRAASAVESVTAENIRAAVSNAKGIFFSVDATAPIILLPQTLRGTLQETTLTVSLGRICFHTQTLSESEKQRRLANTDKTEEALYYSSKASFSKFFVGLTSLEEAVRQPQAGMMLIPEVSIEANVLQLIEDCSDKRDKLIIRLNMPKLKIVTSMHLMYLLTNVMEAWGSNWSEGAPWDKGVQESAGGTFKKVSTRCQQDASDFKGQLKQLEWSRVSSSNNLLLFKADQCDSGVTGASLSSYGRKTSGCSGSTSSAGRVSVPTSSLPASSDLPILRVELLVESLDLSVHEDDPAALQTAATPRFSLSFTAVEITLETRTVRCNYLLVFHNLCIMDRKDSTCSILGGNPTLRVGIGLSPKEAALIEILIEPSVTARFGTPLIELAETLMDITNLFFSLSDRTSKSAMKVHDGGSSKQSGVLCTRTALRASGESIDSLLDSFAPVGQAKKSIRRVDDLEVTSDLGASTDCVKQYFCQKKGDLLAYQLQQIKEQCSIPDTHVAGISICFHGTSTLELLNRRCGDTADYLLATVSVTEVMLSARKNAVTMEMKGSVGEFSVRAAPCHGLCGESNVIIQHASHLQQKLAAPDDRADEKIGGDVVMMGLHRSVHQLTARTLHLEPHRAASVSTQGGACSDLQTNFNTSSSPHALFSFSKYKPIMPVFEVVDGKRKLINASEVRYSNSLELELGASTVTVDVYTIALLGNYFTTGFFSRIFDISNRPLYNGKELPSVREGPRLLTCIRVLARDIVLVLPLDPRKSSESFKASLGHTVFQSSLHAAECHQTLNISLSEISLWRDKVGQQCTTDNFLPVHTSVEVALRSSIDPESGDATRMTIKSEDITLNVTAEDLLDGCQFFRQNLSRATVAPEMSVAETPLARQVTFSSATDGTARVYPIRVESLSVNDGASLQVSPEAKNYGMFLYFRCNKIALRFADNDFLGGTHFEFSGTGISLVLTPAQAVNINWRSFAVTDMRRNTSASRMLLCDEGCASLAALLTTRVIVMRNFGARTDALGSTCIHSEESFACDSYFDMCLGGDWAKDHAALLKPQPLTKCNELLNMSSISVDFTLRRFAVSDQWLKVYDFFCNEALSKVWGATMSEVHSVFSAAIAMNVSPESLPDLLSLHGKECCESPTSSQLKQELHTEGSECGCKVIGGFRCTVSTPSVVVPFLTDDCRVIAEANITSLCVDIVSLPENTDVVARVQEVEVVDTKSGKRLLSKRRPMSNFPDNSLSRIGAAPTIHADYDDCTNDTVEPDEAEELGSVNVSLSQLSNFVGSRATCSFLNTGLCRTHSVSGSPPSISCLPKSTSDKSLVNSGKSSSDVLRLTINTNPGARKNSIQLTIGQLDVLCSMPIIYGLLEYAASPSQPISMIANLGVMREQRERVARVAQEMASQSIFCFGLFWCQPRIIVVGDATDMKKQSKNMQVYLGTMRATIMLDKRSDAFFTVFKAQDFSIPDMLQKSTLKFAFKKHGMSEAIQIGLDRTVGLFFANDVNHIMSAVYRNLLLPSTMHYYGNFGAPLNENEGCSSRCDSRAVGHTGALVQAKDSSSLTLESSTTSPSSDPTVSVLRTVEIQINGLLVEMYDFVGIHTHTFSISEVIFQMAPSGDIHAHIPNISAVEHFTNSIFLHSSSGAGPEPFPTAAAPTPEGSSHPNARLPDYEGSLNKDREHALVLDMVAAQHTTTIYLSHIILVLAPRGVGALVNTLMSLNLSEDLRAMREDDTAPSDAFKGVMSDSRGTMGSSAQGPGPITTDTRPTDVSKRNDANLQEENTLQLSSRMTLLDAATGMLTSGPSTCIRAKIVANFAGCEVRLMQCNCDVAVARFISAKCVSETFADGSTHFRAALDDLTVEDACSPSTLHKTLVLPYGDAEELGGDRSQFGGKSPLKFTHTHAADALLVSSPYVDVVGGSTTITSASSRKLMEFSLRTCPNAVAQGERAHPGAVEASRAKVDKHSRASLTYTKQLSCVIGSVSFTIVPDVMRALAGTLSEVQLYITERNRSKAYGYMSDKAAAAAQAVQNEATGGLVDLSVVISRPRILIVEHATSVNGIELFPGKLIVKSALVDSDRDPSNNSCGMQPSQREIFTITVKQMGMRLLGKDAFKESCHINMVYRRGLSEAMRGSGDEGSFAGCMTDLTVSILRLAMGLSNEQLAFGLDVIGAFLNGNITTTDLPVDAMGSVDVSQPLSRNSGGINSIKNCIALSDPVPGSPHHRSYTHISDPIVPTATSSPISRNVVIYFRDSVAAATDAAESRRIFRVAISIGFLKADLAEVFCFDMDSCTVCLQFNSACCTEMQLRVKQFNLLHASARVRAPDDRRARIGGPVNVLCIHEAVVESRVVRPSMEDKQLSVSEEHTMRITFGSLKVSMTPNVLLDIRNVFYRPFCVKVLRIPNEPVPVLRLNKEETTLQSDVTLDSKHILLTANNKRCCYHLNLNGHRLLFTGLPSAQIMLSKGCELTISSGTIIIPGMYTIGSYVSFGVGASLDITADCKIQKQYLNMTKKSSPSPQVDSKLSTLSRLTSVGGGQGIRTVTDDLDFGSARALVELEVSRTGDTVADMTLACEHHSRFICDFHCCDVMVRLASESTQDLTSSLCMQTRIVFMQDMTNNVPVQRNASMKLLDVRSGEHEGYTLLRTTFEGNLSGVENISVSIVFGPLEFCFRTIFLRLLAEVTKEMQSSFEEEILMRRMSPVTQLESSDLNLLVPVMDIGRCHNCGHEGANLAEKTDKRRMLCYRCCTGHESLPLSDFRIEIPLVDVILFGSGGELSHGCIRGALFSLDPNTNLQVSFTSTLYNFNNATAVWEPFLENFHVIMSGTMHTHDYHVRIDRLDYVISPHNIHVLSIMVADYKSTVVQGGYLDRKFHKPTVRQPLSDHSNHASLICMDKMNVEEIRAATGPDGERTAHPVVEKDSLAFNQSHGSSGTKDTIRIQVEVQNFCDSILIVHDQPVEPYVGKISFVTHKRTVLIREKGSSATEDEGYVVSLTHPPLYTQGRNLLMETVVDVCSGGAQHHLIWKVHLMILPLHDTKALICIENQLNCCLTTGGGNVMLHPGKRFYLSAHADLKEPLVVRPDALPNKLVYNCGVKLDGSAAPSIHEVLCGLPVMLRCCCRADPAKEIIAHVIVRQEAIRGGVPTFVITVEARYRVWNRLPHVVVLNVSPDPKGDIVCGRIKPTHTESIMVEEMQQVEFPLGSLNINQVAYTIEAYQRSSGKASVGKKTAEYTSLAETFPSPTPAAGHPTVFEIFVSSYVSLVSDSVLLVSNYDREMIIRVELKDDTILLTTPFCLLNHTSHCLTLRECNSEGEVRRLRRERNYGVLDANMDASIAAFPKSLNKFFVNLSSGNFIARMLPLHVQQRGLILLQEQQPPEAKRVSSGRSFDSRRDATGGARNVIHLAYVSQVANSGAVLVIITPRWIVVNRSSVLLYAFPSNCGGASVQETAAALRSQRGDSIGAALSSQHAKLCASAGDASLPGPGGWCGREQLGRLPVAVQLPPGAAVPLYRTPYCTPEAGYHLYILQSLQAPLHGMPVPLETIHSEIIVAYPQPEGEGSDSQPQWTASSSLMNRDLFLEVSLAARGSYTYVMIEEPHVAPYVVLNRTRYDLVFEDVSSKAKGRVMARVQAGCCGELILDPTTSTCMRVVAHAGNDAPRRSTEDIIFDVSRTMTDKEYAKAPGGLRYRVSYGENGQSVVEILEATSPFAVSHTIRACPPTPLGVGLNVKLATVAVVMADKDLFFAAITDIRVSWDRNTTSEALAFSIKNFQIDNQTEESPHYDSCVLALRKSEDVSAISGCLKHIITSAKSVLYFDEARLDVVPIALRVSDTLLVFLFAFMRQLTVTDPKRRGLATTAGLLNPCFEVCLMPAQGCPNEEKLFEEAPLQMDFMATRVVLEHFIVNPIQLRLWLTRDEENNFILDQVHTRDAALLSLLVSSCEDVHINAPGIVCVKRSSRMGVMLEWIGKSYVDGLFAQIHGALLQYASSLPLVGAPVKLVTGIGEGAVRLFMEPIEALSTSPKAFAQGLASGSMCFAQGVAGGGLGAFANLTDTGSRLLSIGGGVSERERRKQNTWTGLTSGIKGIVQRPVTGAAESGTLGALKGTAQGLLGIFVNPVSGLLSDVSRATDTLAKLVSDVYIPETTRLRPIRNFYANGGVAPWRSLVAVCEYERMQISSHQWSKGALLSTADEQEWQPCPRELVVYGSNRTPVPASRWILDRYDADFEGWSYSTKYNGAYVGVPTAEMRTRRRRWVAMIRALPYTPIAFHLGVCPGMETAHQLSNSRVGPAGATSQTSSRHGNVDKHKVSDRTVLQQVVDAETSNFLPPGDIRACSLRRAIACRSTGRDLLHQNTISDFLCDEDATGDELHGHCPLQVGSIVSNTRPLAIGARGGSTNTGLLGESNSQPLPSLASPSTTVIGTVVQDPLNVSISSTMATMTIEVFEFERKSLPLGWSKQNLPPAFPAWQDACGREVPKPSDIPVPEGWSWKGSWTCTDTVNDGWSVLKGDNHVRRRRWQRRIVRHESGGALRGR